MPRQFAPAVDSRADRPSGRLASSRAGLGAAVCSKTACSYPRVGFSGSRGRAARGRLQARPLAARGRLQARPLRRLEFHALLLAPGARVADLMFDDLVRAAKEDLITVARLVRSSAHAGGDKNGSANAGADLEAAPLARRAPRPSMPL